MRRAFIWLISYILLFAISGAVAFLSFVWLAAGALRGIGLMPWLAILLISLGITFWAAWRLRL